MAKDPKKKYVEGSANLEKGKSFQSKQALERRKSLHKQRARNEMLGAKTPKRGPTRNPSSKVSRTSRPVPTGRGRMS